MNSGKQFGKQFRNSGKESGNIGNTGNKTYAFYVNDLDEASYLTSILNSSVPNLLMKDFKSKGLFGARDVHKKILDIYYPRFDKNDEVHLRLAELSKEAHEKTGKFLEASSQAITLSNLPRQTQERN
jgi:hypothetical protein